MTGFADKSFATVQIPSTVQISGLTYKVTQIKRKSFYGNKKITQVAISSKYLTKIGNGAFRNCKSLKNITISSKKLKNIGMYAFAGLKKLSSVTIQSSLLKKAKVGSGVFKGDAKNCKIKVPAKKVKEYKEIFEAKGAKKIIVTK